MPDSTDSAIPENDEMDTEGFKCILALEKYRYRDRAAEYVGISTSRFNRYINQFENETNITVFDKSRKPYAFTDELREILPYIRSIVDYTDRITCSGSNHDIPRTISVGCSELSALFPLTKLLAKFSHINNVRYVTYFDNTDTIIRLMRSGELDYAFIPVDMIGDDMIQLNFVITENYGVLIPGGIGLTDRNFITKEDIMSIFCSIPDSSPIELMLIKWFDSNLINYGKCHSLAEQLMLSDSGVSLNFVPMNIADLLNKDHLCVIRMSPDVCVTTVAVKCKEVVNRTINIKFERFLQSGEKYIR